MATIKRFEDLNCWKAARELVTLIYTLIKEGQISRDFGFCDQIRRAAISTMNNIAEGFESRTSAKFVDYLGYAKASACEVRSQLDAGLDLGYIDKKQFSIASQLAEKCSRQIFGLIRYLNSPGNTFRIRENGSAYIEKFEEE